MDFNGISGDGFTLGELPLGFGMALAMNEPALQGYAALTEAEKEELILRCKDVQTRDEMQRIVDSLAPGTDIQAIRGEDAFL